MSFVHVCRNCQGYYEADAQKAKEILDSWSLNGDHDLYFKAVLAYHRCCSKQCYEKYVLNRTMTEKS